MFAGLALLLLVVPIVELYVILRVGAIIGVLPTLALLIGVSIAGTLLLKREGAATWRRLQATLRRGEMPTDEVSDGALIMFGGALLLTPGFVTDIVGLSLIFPPTRSVAKGMFARLLGAAALKRFPGSGAAYAAGRKVYQGRVSSVQRRAPSSPAPEQLPSGPPHLSVEDGSPDKG